MTIHAIRVCCAPNQQENPEHVPEPEPPELPDVVPERVSRHVTEVFEEVLPEQATPMREVVAGVDGGGTVHLRELHRFSDADDRGEIVDAIEREVVADAAWYRIDSHVCTHDEENGGPCAGWTVEREFGTIPEDI